MISCLNRSCKNEKPSKKDGKIQNNICRSGYVVLALQYYKNLVTPWAFLLPFFEHFLSVLVLHFAWLLRPLFSAKTHSQGPLLAFCSHPSGLKTMQKRLFSNWLFKWKCSFTKLGVFLSLSFLYIYSGLFRGCWILTMMDMK